MLYKKERETERRWNLLGLGHSLIKGGDDLHVPGRLLATTDAAFLTLFSLLQASCRSLLQPFLSTKTRVLSLK
jgi:hypothetical protein